MAWFQGNYKQALKEAGQRKVPLLVEFSTDWCGYCKQMDREVFPQESVQAFLKGFVALQVDAEKGEGIELAKRFAISGYPTFVVVDARGEELDRLPGAADAEGFVKAIGDIRAGVNTLGAWQAKIRTNPKDGEARAALALKYADRGDDEAADVHIQALLAADPGYASPHTAAALQIQYGRASAAHRVAAKENKEQEREAAAAEVKRLSDLVLTRYAASDAAALILNDRMRTARNAKDWPTVLATYRQILAIHPDDDSSLNGYAWDTTEANAELEQGLVAIQKALTLKPGEPMYLDTLAEVQWKLGRKEDAIATIKEAIAKAPDDPYYGEQLEKFQGTPADAP